MKRTLLFIILLLSLLSMSCRMNIESRKVTIYYPHDSNPNQYFQMVIPKTDHNGAYEVNGDRCYIFFYPQNNTNDTTILFISHSGFERCDCSYSFTLNKVEKSYNDSVFKARFEGDPNDESLFHQFLATNKKGDTLLLRVRFGGEFDTNEYVRIRYLGDTGSPQLKDTTILEGYDEKNLAWKEVKIKSKNVIVGYINAPQKYKAYYDNILSTLKLIDTTSVDPSKNSLILK